MAGTIEVIKLNAKWVYNDLVIPPHLIVQDCGDPKSKGISVNSLEISDQDGTLLYAISKTLSLVMQLINII